MTGTTMKSEITILEILMALKMETPREVTIEFNKILGRITITDTAILGIMIERKKDVAKIHEIL